MAWIDLGEARAKRYTEAMRILLLMLCLTLFWTPGVEGAPMSLDGLVPAALLARQQELAKTPVPSESEMKTLWTKVVGNGEVGERLLALHGLTRGPSSSHADPAARLLAEASTPHLLQRGLARALCAWDDERGAQFFARSLKEAGNDDERLLILGDLCFVPRSVAIRRCLEDFSNDEGQNAQLRQAAFKLSQTRLQQPGNARSSTRWLLAVGVFFVFLCFAGVEAFRGKTRTEGLGKNEEEESSN